MWLDRYGKAEPRHKKRINSFCPVPDLHYLCRMMEGKEKLDIQHPEAWELVVSVEQRHVSYVLYAPSVPGSLAIGHVERGDDTLQGLEDAVYDTPELLNEYQRVRVLVHSRHFVLFPGETSDDDCCALVHRAFPDDDGESAVCAMPGNGLKIAWLQPRGMQAFLGRTFSYPQVIHHLVPMCEYFKEQAHGTDLSRMFLYFTPEDMDLAIYRGGLLQCVNTYSVTNAHDAAYFTLNAWRAHGMDQLTDELQLLGDEHQRAAVTPELREYIKYVMPAVFPAAAMRLGRNALQAPLDLILLALCE